MDLEIFHLPSGKGVMEGLSSGAFDVTGSTMMQI